MDSVERKAFCFFAVVLLVTAWTSYGYFGLDEHFQIIEFAGSKLGIVPTQNLPWEFLAEIRPWLQPAVFVGLCKSLGFLGIENRFAWTFVFRLFCAVFGFLAVWKVYRLGTVWFPDKRVQRRHLWLCTTLGFLPFLLVRTSSENLSASFFTIAVCILLMRMNPMNPDTSTVPAWIWLFSGLLLGLAFEFRYQIVIMIGGLGLWLILYAKTRWKSILVWSIGFFMVCAIGMFADQYGYGKRVFPFFNYFRVNLIEGKLTDFGTDPFYAYIYLMSSNIFAPIALILFIATVALWIRKPRHVLVWITLPFFLFHCFVGHKEFRYLFPLLPLILLIPHLVFLKDGRISLPDFFRRPFVKYAYKAICLYNWIWLALFCIYPFCVEPYIKHQRFIYNHRSNISTYYSVDYDPYRRKELTYSFYRPENLAVVEVADPATLQAIAEQNPTNDIYFFSQMPFLENWPNAIEKRTELVNPCYFFFRWRWLLEFSTPILKSLHGRFDEVQCPSLFKIAARE